MTGLSGQRFTVVGAGPGGLTFALRAIEHGATVTVLERASDPRTSTDGYTDRSFNLTLNQVGRKTLGDPRTWEGGVPVIGRAIHGPEGIAYANWGDADPSLLISIPRATLRENLSGFVEARGADIRFGQRVEAIDYKSGAISVARDGRQITGDLVVVADGLHSLADDILTRQLGGELNKRAESLRYVGLMLPPTMCESWSNRHIHFWHNLDAGTVAIGLPNLDGSLAVLLISPYDGLAGGGSPFPDRSTAQARLAAEFPSIAALDPTIADLLVGREVAQFHYKSVSSHVLGPRAVVVGDAGSASPPWAGFGANTAIYSADALCRHLAHGPDLASALRGFEQFRGELARLVSEYADAHGDFLRTSVAAAPATKPIGPVLGQLVNQVASTLDKPGASLLTFPEGAT